MVRTLPQQQLLLELLVMSGEIAVPRDSGGALFWRTLSECRASGWTTQAEVSPGILRIAITESGRRAVRDGA
jgi:hypothetical protein